ncbi:MAG TPA: sensor histidine kinase [Oligoflexus sp.]|uniref:sensor histidine kinase n=1 Tax=Oligoflexus sp. TaxID=1971216 RepID=UPI002D7FA403|nr:sensor histidine kinase [Oligoflexus sp.]HET9237528.1 sensor histidine kinase [Oligoflexus sp.]
MRWFLFILLTFTVDALAGAIDIGQFEKKIAVSKQFEVIEEPRAGMRIEAVPQLTGWRGVASGLKTFKFGITEKAFWVRATLINSALHSRTIYLVSEDPRTDVIDFYGLDGDRVDVERHTGDHTPFASRGFFYRGFAFPVTLAPGESRQIYLRFQSTAPVEIDLQIYPKWTLEAEAAKAGHAGTLYFGAMASIILFNFLLFVSSRERIYLSYCLFQGVTAGAISVSFGSAYGLLWPESPYLNSVMSILLPSLAPSLALIFTASFLGVRSKNQLLWWSMQILAVIQILIGFFGAFGGGYLFVMRSLYYVLILAPLLILIVALVGAVKKDRSATLFLMAWVPLILSAALFSLVRLGYVVSSWPQGVELAFGSIWEAVFLSVCLGDKFNQIKKQEITYLRRIRNEELAAREAELMAEARRREKIIHEREAAANRNLVRVICHDLANPLNIMLNYSSIYEQGEMPWEEAQRYLRKMHSAAVHQQEIIEHVREFEAINSGKIQMKLVPVRVADALVQVQDLMQKRLEEKSIRLIISGLTPSLHVIAEQRSLVYNVLANLLSNAIKFSPDGETIELILEERGDEVLLDIVDQGIGMDAELQSKIFDISSPTTRPGLKGEKGTGFGLPIVKSYVERYQGSLQIVSTPIEESPDQHGTRFTLTLRKGVPAVIAA